MDQSMNAVGEPPLMADDQSAQMQESEEIDKGKYIGKEKERVEVKVVRRQVQD
jgi:hypothetical protein